MNSAEILGCLRSLGCAIIHQALRKAVKNDKDAIEFFEGGGVYEISLMYGLPEEVADKYQKLYLSKSKKKIYNSLKRSYL